MKPCIKTLLLLFSTFSICTSTKAQVDIDKILTLQSQPYDRNTYCVQTINNKLNNSSFHFQGFLQRELGLSQTGDEIFEIENGKGVIQTTYIPGVLINYGNEDLHKVHVKYDVFLLEDEIFVEKMDVWGNWETVANIFIRYYPTTLNIEYLKSNKSEITSYYIEDRSVFSSEIKNGVLQARMSVRTNSGKTTKDFIAEYEAKKADYLKKENEKIAEEKAEKQQFLRERKATTYSLSDLKNYPAKDLQKDFQNELLSIKDYSDPIETELVVTVNFDTLGKSSFNTKSSSANIPEVITTRIKQTRIEAPRVNNYYVKSSDSYKFKISYSESEIKVKKKESSSSFDPDVDQNLKSEIDKYLKGKQAGKYTLSVNDLRVDDQNQTNIETLKFRKPINVLSYIGVGVLVASGLSYYLIQ